MRTFESLSESELLALAIWQEEEDSRIYDQFAIHLAGAYPTSAEMFQRMKGEEQVHQQRLTEMYHEKFGLHIPLIRRQDVRGFVRRRPVWLAKQMGLETVRKQAESMEAETYPLLQTLRRAIGGPACEGFVERSSRRRSGPRATRRGDVAQQADAGKAA
jgi:rubrerythrin